MIRSLRAAFVVLFVVFSAIPALAQESWDLIRVGGVKIGNQHIRVEKLVFEGRKLQRVTYNQVFSFLRGGNRTTMEVRYGTIETPEGAVLKLDTRTKTGGEEMKTTGELADGMMVLTLSAGGQVQKQTIPWGDDILGPYGPEMSIARSPMKPGESRDLKTFVPGANKVLIAKLNAVVREPIQMGQPGDKRELIRIEETMFELDGKPLPEYTQTFWVDDKGQVLRTYSDMLPGGLYVFRTTEAAAKARNGDFDLTEATTFKTTRRIADAERTRLVRYRITMKEADPSAAFPTDARQKLTSEGPRTAILEVRTVPVGQGPVASETPGAEYLRPNPLINSADPEVVGLMQKAVGSRTDPWDKAVAIEEWVYAKMEKKNFNTAFASATEVARKLEGDCTEHGVLTAALCRAAGIPARVAVGMLYVDSLGGFGMHMWNEVFIDGRWIAIDATWKQSDVDAVHLKFADTSLDGVSPFDAFTPVIRFLGKMKVEPIEVH